MRHILVARQVAAVAHVWTFGEFSEGRWVTLLRSTGAGKFIAVDNQTSLKALVDQAIAERRGADLTITPRSYAHIVQRGDPAMLDVPSGASLQLLCPLRADDLSVWVHVLVVPATNTISVMTDRKFVLKRLDAELRWVLNQADIEARTRRGDERELWVRHHIAADQIAPEKVRPLPPPPDPKQEEARAAEREQKAQLKRRGELAKKASRRQAEAERFNRESREAYGRKLLAEAAKKSKSKA